MDNQVIETIEPDIFKKYIHLHNINNPKLEEKYNTLYSKYECFSDTFQYVKVNKSGGGGFIHHNKTNDYRKSKGGYNKDFRKTVNGFINKINISNYDIFIAKLRLLLSYDNLPIIINIIIKNSVYQDSYINLLVKLLCDLIDNSGLNGGTKLIKEIIIQDYIEFVNNNAYKIINNIEELDNFDKFILKQKHKKEFINKNKYFIQLTNNIQENLINFNDYFEVLWIWFLDEYNNYCKDRNEYYIDIFINIFIEISKFSKNKDYIISKKTYILSLLNEENISFKLKFSIEQLLNLL